MRKLFLAGFAVGSLIMPAMAADMTPYDRAPLQALPFNWTGAYIGVDVGGAWAKLQSNGFGTGSTSGAVGGLYAGYNWQFAPQWLLGVELDMNWTDLTRVNWLTSMRGRIGFTPAWNMLLYFTGGAAWSEIDKAADALIASTYLAGTNTRRVRRALRSVFGGEVCKDTVSRVWRKVKGDWDAWNSRSLPRSQSCG